MLCRQAGVTKLSIRTGSVVCPVMRQHIFASSRQTTGAPGVFILKKDASAVQEKASEILPEEERLQLLRQLKLKWAQINSQFLRLPFTLDTPAKRRRKEIYEAQLAQIEKDVRLLQSSEEIVITSD